MLILLGTLVALLLVPVLRGRLRNLSTLRLDRAWLIGVALGLQILCISIVPTWPRLPLVVMHVASYLLAAAFVWRNRTLPGLPLLAAGGVMNAVTIGLNGGTLPASAAALRKAGLPVTQNKFLNSGVLAHPKLSVFGDNYASPDWLPLHNVYSLGDLLILCGAVWLVHRTCGTILGTDRRPALRAWRAAHLAATTVPIERHLDVLDFLDEVMYERDQALEALRLRSAVSIRRVSWVAVPVDSWAVAARIPQPRQGPSVTWERHVTEDVSA
jgi:hypothetical protein